MALIVSTIDVDRPPDVVFGYATDATRFGEWQEGVVSGHVEGPGPPAVGSRCTTTRLLGGRPRTTSQVIVTNDPPRSWAVRGVDGPIRADATVAVEPVQGGARSRLTVTLDFHGHGLGKLVLPLVLRQARREVPQSCRRLKERLERAA